MLSLPLVSPCPLGPSLGQLSLLRPGGRLSRLLRPGGRLICQSHPTSPSTCQSHPTSPSTCQSHPTSPSTCQSHPTSPSTCQSHPTSPSTCQSHPTSPSTCQSHPTSPSTCQSHPTSPSTCQSHPTSPSTCQSHPTSPPTCQSHPTSPPTCQSHPTSPPTCQSHPTSPPTCQSHPTSPPTCQSHPTSPPTCQSHLTSLLSPPPRPGGLLSHWPHMDLALRPLPRFHLRSTTLLEYAMCKRLEAALWGGGGGLCHESGYHSLKLHITHGLHLPSCTALTHSRPPLHPSHSCHHSLINPNCLTTPAPHSLTHIKEAHKHSLTAKSCFAPADILSVILPAISVFDPGLPDLGTLNLCL